MWPFKKEKQSLDKEDKIANKPEIIEESLGFDKYGLKIMAFREFGNSDNIPIKKLAKPSDQVKFKGGNGKTPNHAIAINGALNEADGIKTEYYYIEKIHGIFGVDWKRLSQKLLLNLKTSQYFDEIEVLLKEGKTITYYFDITSFIGK